MNRTDIQKILPRPECKHGYTRSQIIEIVGLVRIRDFDHWMRGQTMCLCDGWVFNHDKKAYEPSGCSKPHGPITYECDIERYLLGLTPLD